MCLVFPELPALTGITWRDFLLYADNQPLLFTQALFWFLFGGVLLIYPLIYKSIKARNLFLMAFSWFFYYKTGGWFLFLLLFTALFDFTAAQLVYRSTNLTKRRALIVASVAINLGVLAYFKYTFFFVDALNYLTGAHYAAQNWLAGAANTSLGTHFDVLTIILPVGVSFYTFQSMSYTIDVYRGDLKPVTNFLDFAFFVSFFPQLVAGPIVRASDFVPQIYQPYSLTSTEYGRAVFLVVNGLAKKILISDYLAANFVDRVFASPLQFTGFENLMAVYGYAIQIYCDFSGYTDIAIGVALLLGFRLALNFDSPYQSTNITEFWRRWHISLSSWLRDYLYIPLGGNRHGKARAYLNQFLTMLLGGLWHGASIRFMVWGALHGSALAVHKAWRSMGNEESGIRNEKTGRRFFIPYPSFLSDFFSWALTFHFVCFCWIFFRADSMATAVAVVHRIATAFQPELIPAMLPAYARVFGLLVLAYYLHFIPRAVKEGVRGWFGRVPDLGKALLIVAVVVLLFQVKNAQMQPFIYFQF
ncbi:MAG: MBOAT family protein [Hymenobacteraceae bacterium]|nr:MBOAT family protein [Hymenobacteraceae bacterium]